MELRYHLKMIFKKYLFCLIIFIVVSFSIYSLFTFSLNYFTFPGSSTIKETTETNIINVSLASDLRKQTNFIPDLLNKTSEFSNVSSTWLLNNLSSNSTQNSFTGYLIAEKLVSKPNNNTQTRDTIIIGTYVNANIVIGAVGGVSVISVIIYCFFQKVNFLFSFS